MPNIIKEHLLSMLSKGIREDGRKLDEYRTIEIETGVSSKSAEGSARVRIGGTEVIAGVKLEVSEPYPDTLDQGSIMVNVELLPLSNPEFESGPPSIDSIELSRVVDRSLREGGAVDLKKLCIKEGEAMWIVIIDIYPINDDGNLFDACALAALAAMKDAKFPKLEKDNKINYKERTTKSLPVKGVPVSCTVYKLGSYFLIDPNMTEFKLADARMTMVFLDDGMVCAMQKGGEMSFTKEELLEIYDLSLKKTKELRGKFKK